MVQSCSASKSTHGHSADKNTQNGSKDAPRCPRPPRAVFDAATAELAGSPTVLEALKWVVVAEMLVIVRGELEEEETDVTLNDSDVLVDAKVQKLWARVSAVGSSFGHRGTTQFVSPVVNSALYGIFSWRIVKKGRSNAPGQKQFTSATLVQFASAIDSCKQFVTKQSSLVIQGWNNDSWRTACRVSTQTR